MLFVLQAGAAEKDVPLYKHIADLAGNSKLVRFCVQYLAYIRLEPGSLFVKVMLNLKYEHILSAKEVRTSHLVCHYRLLASNTQPLSFT